jgi:flagellar biosynthetic protein FliR
VAPILVLLMLVSVTIGLLARAVPQLNILEMSFTLRIGLGLFAMFAFAPLAGPALHDLFAFLASALDEALVAMQG